MLCPHKIGKLLTGSCTHNILKNNKFLSLQTMYDLLMDMLDERGIGNDFVLKLVDFCTSYEHDQYVSFLEKFKAVIKE